MRNLIFVCGLTLLAGGFAQAAEVKVEWQEPEKFTDIRPANDSRKAYRLQELRRTAAKRGVRLDLQPFFFPVNPAPASYAIIAAAKANGAARPRG